MISKKRSLIIIYKSPTICYHIIMPTANTKNHLNRETHESERYEANH